MGKQFIYKMELLEIIGPIKIKDALFIGDEVAAQVRSVYQRT